MKNLNNNSLKHEITQSPSRNRPRLYVNVQPKDWQGAAAESRRAVAMRKPKKTVKHHIDVPTAKSRNGNSDISPTEFNDIVDNTN